MSATCDTYREAAELLSRPFTPEAIRWKVQTIWPKDGTPQGGLVVAYIDAGLVVSRLNLLVPHLWHDQYEDLGQGEMLCRLTVDAITREDVGQGATRKARYSDSLKRAAVKFGVGVSLRRIPRSRITAGAQAKAWGSGSKRGLDLTQAGLDYLRQRYRTWLHQQGAAAFGAPLDHGDAGDAQGDEDADAGGLASDAQQAGLLDELSGGRFTLRQQRGFLAAAGVLGLPQTLSPEQVASALRGLSEEQGEKLTLLLSTAAERAESD